MRIRPLTTGVDHGPEFTGTSGNDTFNADYDVVNGGHTLGALDVLIGGAGVDTLQITDQHAGDYMFAAATLDSIENVTVRTAQDATVNVSGANITGLQSVAVTQSVDATVTAASTTAVNVSGATGAVTLVGGASQTVSLANQGGNAALSESVGAVSFTSAKHGANLIDIDGGTSVTVSTSSIVDNGAIVIGDVTAPSGAVSVTSKLNGDGTTTLDQGDITITGGSTVTVNSTVTVVAKDQTASAAHTLGDVRVNGDGKTTSVTVNQTYAETEFTKAAVAVVKELHTVTFAALTSGQTTTVDGLTFKAAKDLTAAEVAQAFAGLTASDTQSSGGKVANGVFTGNLSANFTSGAANGAVVVFTAKDESETLSLTAGDVDPTETVVAGTAAVAKSVSANSATYGAVRVDDAAVASITSLTLNGYAAADLGDTSANNLNALTSLSLANSGGTATVDTSATTLALTVNKVANTVDLSGAASLKTLNITATGADSKFGLSAAAVETLTVAGTKALDISTGSTLTALKTVTVTDAASVKMVATGANVTAVSTAGSTGTNTFTINATNATYTGGAGVDAVTLSATAPAQAVSLGAGNDTLTLATGTSTATGLLSGGDGTDTLVMASADAATASATEAFKAQIDGFEKLSLGVVADGASDSVNLANLDGISYVVSAGTVLTSARETFTVTFAGAPVAAQTLIFDGVTSTAANTVLADLITVAAGKTYTNWTVTGSTGTTITFEAKTAGNKTDAVSGDFTGTYAGTHTPVTSIQGVDVNGALTVTHMANAGTLELTAAGTGATVTMTDATGTADSFNIVTKVDAAGINFGTVAVAGVETVNITATDTSPVDKTTGDATISAATLALSDSAAKTVVITGQSDLSLSLASALAVTSVDASAFTGKLSLTATGTDALTILGGSAADTLTASGSGDVLNGGAGKDILTGAILTTLTGGAGNDTFKFTVPTNVNSYSTITDLSSGDVIDLDAANAGTVVFAKSAVTLQPTAVFQDYANAAVNAMGADTNDAAWFQFGGDTYIVQSGGAHDVTADFHNGSDSIVKIVGLVDLSSASYNQTIGTLEIV